MTDRLYVATHESIMRSLLNQNLPAVMYGDPSGRMADEFVVVGPDSVEKMQEMRAAGLPAEALKYSAGVGMPIRHFHWESVKFASEIPATQSGAYHHCGISGLNNVLQWRYPEVIVTAGPYGSGKSLFAQLLAQDVARSQGAVVSLCCWEDQADEIRDAIVRHRDTAGRNEEGDFAQTFLDKFLIATIDASKDRFLSEYLDLVEYQVKAFGARHFVLDPWNEFDHQKHSKQSETEYVREVMKALRRLVDRLKIQINIVTHVSAEFINADGTIKPFRVAHAFGSSQFANKADRAFCIIRSDRWAPPGETHMIARQDKVKVEDKPGLRRMGRKATLAFKYGHDTHSLYFDGKVTGDEDLQKIWRG